MLSRFQILRIVKKFERKGSVKDERHFKSWPSKKVKEWWEHWQSEVLSLRKHQESQSGQCLGTFIYVLYNSCDYHINGKLPISGVKMYTSCQHVTREKWNWKVQCRYMGHWRPCFVVCNRRCQAVDVILSMEQNRGTTTN